MYILARDNQMGNIKDELVARPDHLLALAEKGLNSTESDARWQLAEALGLVDAADVAIDTFLVRFHHDDDEYVRRRALLASGNRKSGQAEAMALRSWDTGHEYQQMAALHVLWCVNSPHFDACRQAAERDPRPYLARAAVKDYPPSRGTAGSPVDGTP